MEPKVFDIETIKNSLEELEKLSESLAPLQETKLKALEKDNRKLDTVYSRILEAASDIETKNFNLITEYSENSGYGAWNEEEKAFVDKTMLKLLFQDEGWVYTVVDLIACKISNQPLKVYRKTKENGKEVIEEAADHPFNKVLELPNPMQSYFDWMYCIAVDLNLCGDAFLLKAFGTDSIYHLPSETMQIFMSAEGELVRFDRFASNMEGGRKLVRSFAIDEIIHIRRPNASSFFQGFSAFTAGRKSILFNRYSLEYLNNYYLKGASSGLVLELSKDANPANAQRLLRSFELAYLGRKNQRRVKILPQGVTAKNLGETLASQELKDYLAMNKEDILALLKVPKHEVGLQSAGSLGSEEYKTAVKNFWESTLKPAMGLIKGALNRKLADKLGEGYFLDFDLSGVEALKDNEIQKGEIAKGMLQTHTVNEVREILYSLGKIEGGDVIPTLQQPAMPNFGFGLNSKPSIEAPKEEDKPIIHMPEQQRIELFTDQADKLIKASGDWFERRKRKIAEVTKKPMVEVTEMFLGLFADQAIEVIKNLDKIVKKSININDEKRVKKVIDAAIKEQIRSLKEPLWLKEKEEVDEYIRMTFDHPAYAGEQKIIDKIKEKTQRQAEAFIKERNDYIFELLNRKTSDDIYKIIANSSKTSDTITQIAEAISKSYANPEKMYWRGERIARTEVLTIMSKTQDLATKEAAKIIPGLKKMWVSTFDDRTRGNPNGLYKDSKADHWELHGQIRNEPEDFEDPRNKDLLAFPRDPKGRAESVINCFVYDTEVDFNSLIDVFRSRYIGEVKTITLEDGTSFTATANHPILTVCGWVSVNGLNEGDQVIKAKFLNSFAGTTDDVKGVKPKIGEVFDSLSMSGDIVRIPVGVVNFHGDIPAENVDIININGLLKGGAVTRGNEKICDSLFKYAKFGKSGLLGNGGFNESLRGVGATEGAISCSNLPKPSSPIHSFPFESFGLTAVSLNDTIGIKMSTDSNSTESRNLTDLIYAKLFNEMQSKKIIKIVTSHFDGHVFNLHTKEGFYTSNGVISQNCRCTSIVLPAKEMDQFAREEREAKPNE